MNGVLVIDKPAGWTSHDVVAKLRGLLRERRIGHGGTLDPMATGVLPVFVGRATRAVEFMESADKEYRASLRLGVETDTQDITGTVLRVTPQSVTEQELETALAAFRGDIMQLPPMYSAIKVGGKKLYELARRGVEAERQPRPVTIYKLEQAGRDGGDFVLDVVCSKGTYIRALCADIGAALGCGGTMSALRRVRAGAFLQQDALTLEQVASAAEQGGAPALLRAVDTLFDGYAALTLDAEQERRCRNGGLSASAAADGVYRAYGIDGSFLALCRVQDGELSNIKSFF